MHLQFLLVLSLTSVGMLHVQGLPANEKSGNSKLLYIMLDGFRYDYILEQPASSLPGFTKLLKNGVRSEYVNPIYPSISYPTWTTLSTGLYPESHEIIGNYFYDPSDETEFSLFDESSTGMEKWWSAEPLWTTATKAGLKAALYLWGRCDIPFDGVVPDTCEHFVKIPGAEIFRTNIDKALDNLSNGYELVQVYTEHVDNTGHNKGPETEDMKLAVRELDEVILYLLQKLEDMDMDDKVNIVIVSDHGMTTTAPDTIARTELDDYLPENAEGIESIADKGGYVNIKVEDGYLEEIYSKLKEMPKAQVFKKEDIPDDYHIKNAKFLHDIVIFADIDNFVMASHSDKQLPRRNDDYVYYGAHGYSPDEMKMKSIFFAHGPAFKKDLIIEPIDIVDIYQVLMATMKVDARPNNGTWDKVKDVFVDEPSSGGISFGSTSLLPLMSLLLLMNFLYI